MKFHEDHLYDKLIGLSQSGIYPFHMPGHKRNMAGYPLEQLWRMDITEVDGFDNLHEPQGVLAALQERISSLYHTKETFCLINGSSCGVLSAISACTKRRGSIMLARNSHKSAYHAILMEELTAVYLYPQYWAEYDLYGEITPQTVEEAYAQNPDCRTVLITSPTYEGIVSDLGRIAEIVHDHGGILIVDEAHGAHLRFTGQEEMSAVTQGADIVVQSVHKTLPAPTQTALLHICSDRVNREEIRRYLRIYQSSSPSYVLLAGIEQCFLLLEKEGREREHMFRENLELLYRSIGDCRKIRIVPGTERGKLALSVRNTAWTGQQLYEALLEQYGLQMEMAADSYVVAILTLFDSREGLERLADALLALDLVIEQESERVPAGQRAAAGVGIGAMQPPEAVLSVFEAVTADRELIALEQCAGRAAAEFVNLYPPGIPVIAPGEVYTQEMIKVLTDSRSKGLNVQGLDDRKRVYAVRA